MVGGSGTVIVHVEVQTQDINNLSLQIQVPSSPTTDQLLREASNRLIQLADEIRQAVEQNGALHFE
jgi:DNA-directed RNA polymerase subunit L